MNRAEILDTARQIVTQGRNDTYGEPEDLFAALHLVKRGLDMARGGRARRRIPHRRTAGRLRLAQR